MMRQAAIAVLLFVFLAGISFAGVAEDLADGKSLEDVIADSLAWGATVDGLVADLVAAEVDGKDTICGMFTANAEKYEVIAAALDNGMDSTDVVNWSYQCGADREDIQEGFSIAGESLPADQVFQHSRTVEENTQEYLYNPPSQSN